MISQQNNYSKNMEQERIHAKKHGDKYYEDTIERLHQVKRSWVKFCLFPDVAELCRMPSMFPFPTHIFRKQFVQNTTCPDKMNVLRMNWQPYACYDQGFLWAYWASNGNGPDTTLTASSGGGDYANSVVNYAVWGKDGQVNSNFPGNSLTMINQPYWRLPLEDPQPNPIFLQPALANTGFSNFACNSDTNVNFWSGNVYSLNGITTAHGTPDKFTNTGQICTICNMIGLSSQQVYTGSVTTNSMDAVTQGGVRLIGAVFEISYVGTVQNMSGMIEIAALSHSKTQPTFPSLADVGSGQSWLPAPTFSADSIIVEQPYYKRYQIDQGGRCIWFPIDNQDFFFGQGINSDLQASSVNQNHAQLQWNINVTNIQPGQGLRINIIQYYEGIVGSQYYDLYMPDRTEECATEAQSKSAIMDYAKTLSVTPARSSPVWDRIDRYAGTELSKFVGFAGGNMVGNNTLF